MTTKLETFKKLIDKSDKFHLALFETLEEINNKVEAIPIPTDSLYKSYIVKFVASASVPTVTVQKDDFGWGNLDWSNADVGSWISSAVLPNYTTSKLSVLAPIAYDNVFGAGYYLQGRMYGISLGGGSVGLGVSIGLFDPTTGVVTPNNAAGQSFYLEIREYYV